MVCAYLGFWNEKQSIILFSTISKFQDEKELWEKGFFFFLKGLLLIYCVCVRKQLTLDKNETNWKMCFSVFRLP